MHALKRKYTPPSGSVMDDRLLAREFYNANDFPVTFTRRTEFDEYILLSGKPVGPDRSIVEPGKFLFMPHALFKASWPEGRLADEVIAHFNFGKDMFKGVKPNRETLRKARKHTKG